MTDMAQQISTSEGGTAAASSVLSERILAAAAELVGRYGPQKTTVAEIARVAGVGKGTTYLYWSSKEELLMALLARQVIEWISVVRSRLAHDSEALLPSHLALLLLRSWRHELVECLASDVYLRRILSAHQRSREILNRSMPKELCLQILPILRRNGFVRDDGDAHEQAYIFDAVMTGFVVSEMEGFVDSSLVDSESALSYVARALFETSDPPERSRYESTLSEVLEVLDRAIGELNDVAHGVVRSSGQMESAQEEGA